MSWLRCVLFLGLLIINNVLAECNSNECTTGIDPTSINVLLTTNTNDDITPADLSFIHTQLLKELLLATDFVQETAKREFVDYYKEQTDSKGISALDKFDREYKRHSALWWYTYPSYIHDVLNEGLRTQNVTNLLYMGFFIQKVHRQLEHIRKTTDDVTSEFTVYRGQGLTYDDYDKLKKNISGLLSFNTFLWANTDREVAFSNARRVLRDGFDTAVIFSITIDPSVSVLTPFASLDDFSYFENSENEYLFSINTVFRIERVEKVAGRGGILLVKLRLTNINDKRVRQLMQVTRKEIEGTSTMFQLAKLMILMEQYSTAEAIYSGLLKERDENDHTRMVVLYHLIGYVREKSGNLSGALASFEHSLEISSLHSQANDSMFIATLSRIADILQKQKKFDAAIEKFQQGLSLELQAPIINYRRLSKFYNDIGTVLNEQGKTNDALEYQEKSLAIDLEHSPNDSINIGISYLNIAGLYTEMQNYTMAVAYYKKSLFVLQRGNPVHWRSVALVHYNIALVLKKMYRDDEAILHLKQAVAIGVSIYPKNHANRQAFEAQLEELTIDIA
jgi:tetratricopeptide (TPR) repeat protein